MFDDSPFFIPWTKEQKENWVKAIARLDEMKGEYRYGSPIPKICQLTVQYHYNEDADHPAIKIALNQIFRTTATIPSNPRLKMETIGNSKDVLALIDRKVEGAAKMLYEMMQRTGTYMLDKYYGGRLEIKKEVEK